MQLLVPRLLFNSERQKLYISELDWQWTYLRENIHNRKVVPFEYQQELQTKTCFVFVINNANISDQTANPFLYRQTEIC